MTAAPKVAPVPRGLAVLVLEDASDVRDRLLPIISEVSGLDVLGVAGSVSEAREVLRTIRPDVALLDLRLPDGSGLEVLREVRARNADAFVAILTSYDTPLMRQSCLAAGADAFLSKSTGLDGLPALLQSIAERGVRE